MQLLVDAFFLIMAVWAIVECYHHGKIFAEVRAYWDAKGGFLGELQGCPYCLSHWVSLLVCVAWAVYRFEEHSPDSLRSWVGVVCYVIIQAFVVVRGANLANDWIYEWGRTPYRTYEPSPSEPVVGEE